MKKATVLLILFVLSMTPLAAFAQRSKTGPQTKFGILSIMVEYRGQQTREINKTERGKTTRGKYTLTVNAKYNFHSEEKAISHDGFVSLVEPTGQKTEGTFSYTAAGQETIKDDNDTSTIVQNDEYSGPLSDGQGDVDTPDQGDGLTGARASAHGEGKGRCETKMSDRQGTETLNYCSPMPLGAASVQIGASEQNPEKPGATQYSVTMSHEVNVRKKVSGDVDTWAVGENWLPLVTDGSFAAGGYQFSFNATRTPKELQSDADGQKITFTETVSVQGSLALGAAGKKQAVNFTPRDFRGFGSAFALSSRRRIIFGA